jgi:hypothetical protein
MTFLIITCSFSAGCGWRHHQTYTSPDKSAYISFYEPNSPLTRGTKILLVDHGKEFLVYEKTGDMFLNIVEVYWTPDGNTVGLFTCGPPFLRTAINRQTFGDVPFSTIEAQIVDGLRTKYSIPKTEKNIFDWLCSHAGTLDFKAKFGDATKP